MKGYDQKVIFLDIDGTIFKHHGIPNKQTCYEAVLLDGVNEKLEEWDKKGYRIILVTSRKESERENTIKQLSEFSIQYDSLIMGLNRGERVIINDKSSTNKKRARAFNINRNEGLKNIKI